MSHLHLSLFSGDLHEKSDKFVSSERDPWADLISWTVAGGLFFKSSSWRLFKVLLPSLMRIQLSIISLACHPKESIITCEHWYKLSSYALMFAVSEEK